MNPLYSIFLKHPEEKNMTYFEHLKHAFSYGFRSLQCSIVFIIHGIVPHFFESTGSTMVQKLNDDLQPHSNKKYDNNVE
jgi:Family of unknown function (DUF6356)